MSFPAKLSRSCAVCRAEADNLHAIIIHFGAYTCRACAAFFKRSVQLARGYICRQSTDNCDIGTGGRKKCQRCRYARCLAVGMKPDSIPTTPNYSVSDADCGLITAPLESTPTSSSQTSLLEAIAQQYSLLEEIISRSDEIVMIEAHGDRLHRRNGHILSTIAQFNQCVRAAHQPMVDFASNCFPEFIDFDDSEKWLVLKNFLTSRFIFDGVHRAQRFFPGNGKIFMVTFHTFVDIDSLDDYISGLQEIYDKKHTVTTMREMTLMFTSDWLGPLLARAALDEVETMAIYGLLFWPSYLASATTRVRETCYKYHLRIFKELQYYYKTKGDVDYPSRVSHIASILLCVQAGMMRLKEDMQIFRLLDVYSDNELAYNIVK